MTVHLIQTPRSQLQRPLRMHTITQKLHNRRGRKFTLGIIQGNAKEGEDVAQEQHQAVSALLRHVRDEQNVVKVGQ